MGQLFYWIKVKVDFHQSKYPISYSQLRNANYYVGADLSWSIMISMACAFLFSKNKNPPLPMGFEY